MGINDDIEDDIIRHAVMGQRFTKNQVRDMLFELSKVEARVLTRLGQTDITKFNQKRLNVLLASVRKIMTTGYSKMNRGIALDLKDFSAFESDWQLDMLERNIRIPLDLTKPSAAQIWASVAAKPFEGRLLREWGKDLSVGAYNRVKGEISQGFVEGRTTDQIIRTLRGTARNGYKDGVLEISRRNATTITRTAINHTATTAREQVYADNPDVIKGVQWVSTLDGRTSEICQSLDGKVFPPNQGRRPPAHHNCRSTTAPVVKSWKEMGINLKETPEGTRSSLNGQVPAGQNYNDWLKKQPKEFQDSVLGKTKGELFRKGGLTVDKFVDNSDHVYSLKELRRREAAAWAKTFGTKAKTKPVVPPTPTPKPKPATKKPTTDDELRNAQWAKTSDLEREMVQPSFADADPKSLAIVGKYGGELKKVRSGNGSYFRTSDSLIQMDKKLSPTSDAYKKTMRHEYGHFIDRKIHEKLVPWEKKTDDRLSLGISRLSFKEVYADGKVLHRNRAREAVNIWDKNKITAANPKFSKKVADDAVALWDKIEADGTSVVKIKKMFSDRGLDMKETMALFPENFTAKVVNGDGNFRREVGRFLAAYDNKDWTITVYIQDGRKTPSIRGLMDSIGASTNQKAGNQFGHSKRYYAKMRSHYDKNRVKYSKQGEFGSDAPPTADPLGDDWSPIAPSSIGSGNAGQVWANWFEAYTSGNKTQYQVFKNYLPKASARFERIIDEYG